MNNLHEINQLLKKDKPPEFTQYEIHNLNSPITTIQSFPDSKREYFPTPFMRSVLLRYRKYKHKDQFL